jgi:hypothetical protein
LTELVPGEIFLDKKSILVLGKSQVGKYGPWVKGLEKLQVWSLQFGIWQNWSLENLNLEIQQTKGAWNYKMDRMVLWISLGNVHFQSPSFR